MILEWEPLISKQGAKPVIAHTVEVVEEFLSMIVLAILGI